MDVIICLSKKDYRIVRKTVRNVRACLQSIDDNIYLIASGSLSSCFSRKWKLSHHVVFISEDTLVPWLSYESILSIQQNHGCLEVYPGWYLQQFLKMGFALSQYAKERYLVWDSDTIPLHKIQMMEADKVLFATKTECNKPYFDTMRTLLGFGKQSDFSFIAEHMVFDVLIMKDLISRIQRSNVSGNHWFEKIINATNPNEKYAFSEFETYGSFCAQFYPEMFKTRQLRTLREGGMLFGRGVKDSELALLGKMGFDTASFEYYHIPPFPRSLVNKYERFVEKHLL